MKKRYLKIFIRTTILVIVVANLLAIFHAYKFTHFTDNDKSKTGEPKELTLLGKISALIFGISNPRPENLRVPEGEFETILLESNKRVECWLLRASQPKGTVALFHGYGGNKSSMLDRAEVFRKVGFNTLLVDFAGSGGSEGNQTTIGYFEAEQGKSAVNFLENAGEQQIFLFGTSMGAVAIMKAVADFNLKPGGLLMECPFGTMYKTVEARFHTMSVPAFPMAGLLVFWGGIQNGFWAFGHNPVNCAERIQTPVLLMYGAKDEKVSRKETDEIFAKLRGPKQLAIYQDKGHENYLFNNEGKWTKDVLDFITSESVTKTTK